MKTFVISVLGALLISIPARANQYWEADDRSPRFCVQNFNAYGPLYASAIQERSERIAGFLQALPKCEVVHLQEVWNDSQINIFESNLKRHYNISAPNRQAKIGLMSLYMGAIKGTETHDFKVNNEGGVLDAIRTALNVKKAFHVARAKFHGIDEDFYFANTHLHPTSSAVRITQILDLLRWRLKNQNAKFLLSGDFNADVGSLERQLVMLTLGVRDSMADYFGGSYPHGYCTYCAGNPLGWMLTSRTFDYVFYSNVGGPQTTLRVVAGEVNMRGTPRKPWSDHFGVRIGFSIEPGEVDMDSRAMELRRDRATQVLEKAGDLLKKQGGEEFRPYVSLLQEMMRQLTTRQGAFNAYFESYR